MEHREVKNQWLSDKQDLTTRLHQVQALNTQLQGTLKKKEKDYDKLQSQLSKLVKDHSKGQKSIITVSIPLKKSFSQDNSGLQTTQSILRDAMIVSLQNTLVAYTKENILLRQSLEDITTSLHQAQSGPLTQDTTTITTNVNNNNNNNNNMTTPVKQQSQGVAEEEEVVVICEKDSSTTPVQSTPTATSTVSNIVPMTPGVKSVQWLVEQTNTVVKQLRARADLVAQGGPGFLPDSTSLSSTTSMISNNSNHIEAVITLKARLAEALKVIAEQDRLIHEGNIIY
jgi:hypothetical protein